MASSNETLKLSRTGTLLQSDKRVKLVEILAVFLAALIPITVLLPLAGENPLMKQGVVWIANILMLLVVWAGIRLRGENCTSLGLHLKFISWKRCGNTFLLSLLVVTLGIAGFIVGSIIMANITGIPEGADMSSYDFMRNNIGMLLLSITGVLIVSSFGEEVIYRGFLINRLEQLMPNFKYATAIAVIISSIIFGFIHYDWGPMGIAQTAFMGLVFAIMYVKLKRRLIILILAHAYMDIALMVQMYIGINA